MIFETILKCWKCSNDSVFNKGVFMKVFLWKCFYESDLMKVF